jgi:hypothetical protein
MSKLLLAHESEVEVQQPELKGDIDAIIKSFMKVGLLQPLLIEYNEEGKLRIVDGKKRYAALSHLGIKFYFVYDVSKLSSSEYTLELEKIANKKRHNMVSWQERMLGVYMLHYLFIQSLGKGKQGSTSDEGWTQKKAAEFFQISEGAMHELISIGKFLFEHPDKMDTVLSKTAFVQKIKKMKDMAKKRRNRRKW